MHSITWDLRDQYWQPGQYHLQARPLSKIRGTRIWHRQPKLAAYIARAWCYTEVRACLVAAKYISSQRCQCYVAGEMMMTMLIVFGACHVASTPLRVVVVVAIGAHCPIYTTKSSSKGRSADFLCLSTKEWTPYLYTKIQFLGVRDTRSCIRLHVMGVLDLPLKMWFFFMGCSGIWHGVFW